MKKYKLLKQIPCHSISHFEWGAVLWVLSLEAEKRMFLRHIVTVRHIVESWKNELPGCCSESPGKFLQPKGQPLFIQYTVCWFFGVRVGIGVGLCRTPTGQISRLFSGFAPGGFEN